MGIYYAAGSAVVVLLGGLVRFIVRKYLRSSAKRPSELRIFLTKTVRL